MKPKVGRPKLPTTRVKNKLIGFRASAAEECLFNNCAERDGITLSAWCRKALLFALRNGVQQ